VSWTPRSSLDSVEGLIWLPRLFAKARRVAESGGRSRLVDGYCYGNNDVMDGRVLRFLRTDDVTVSSILQDHSDDEAARIIVKQSGRTREECLQFSRDLERTLRSFPVIDADEGLLPPGIKATAVRFFYNRLMMPVVYMMFQRAERKR